MYVSSVCFRLLCKYGFYARLLCMYVALCLHVWYGMVCMYVCAYGMLGVYTCYVCTTCMRVVDVRILCVYVMSGRM